jgi:hypothetical protein
MSDHIVLQIAETRFAIRCDYHVFTNWLREVCADFLVQGEPHARLNLNFETNARNQLPPETTFSIIPRHDGGVNNFRVICSYTDKPDKMFRSILEVCLHCSIISKQPPDLWVHSSGVIYSGDAYVFTGPSGAGKSTICKILEGEPGFTILHDEMVALSQTGAGFSAWSSPLRGEKPATHCLGAPLRAIFFLHHSRTNHAVRISGRKVPYLLAANLMKMAITADNSLLIEGRESCNLLLTLAESVPCYDLYFKPDFSFWACIEALSRGESEAGKEKGQSLWQTITV